MALAPPLVQPEEVLATSLSDRAYFELRKLIVSLELPPGSIVNERELMERLGLGRTPVREALRALAAEGLVEVYPRRGMFVSNVEVRDLAALSELRVELEGFAARLAAERATDEERDAARGLLAELDRAAGEEDERLLIELDQRIHRHVYRLTHNTFLEKALNEHFVLSLRIWFLALHRVPRLARAIQEHRKLLKAIADGDGDRAASIMRLHVRGFERAIREVL
jgi:DNA-binding GntR family transcriptional regulator